jgi:hypothetical protein
MVRLYLFAEGQTEQTFAGNVLKPHLAQHGVLMHNPVLIALAKKKGKTHRGGMDNYEPMRNDILRFLAQEKADTDGSVTPELINDGQHSAPSKRIIAQFPDYRRAKPVVGPQVAELIGLDVIRGKSPHFSAWLSRLEQLGAGTH